MKNRREGRREALELRKNVLDDAIKPASSAS
jgi:hypothetical protein